MPIDDLLAAARGHGSPIDYDESIECVETNDKRRYSFDASSDLIRANPGHSVEVDLRLDRREPPEVHYHGAVGRCLASIMAEGLRKQRRRHVHLSADAETAREVGTGGSAGHSHHPGREDAPGRRRILPVGQRRLADGFRSSRIPWLESSSANREVPTECRS